MEQPRSISLHNRKREGGFLDGPEMFDGGTDALRKDEGESEKKSPSAKKGGDDASRQQLGSIVKETHCKSLKGLSDDGRHYPKCES